MQAIGIDLDGNVINLAIMNKNKDLISIKSLEISDIPNSDVKKLYIKNKEKYLITSALDASDVIIKSVDFNVKKSFFLKKAIKFHEDSISAVDPSKTLISTIHLKDMATLKFFITTKEFLQKHLNRLKHLNIDPDQVTLEAQALLRFSNFYFKDINTFFLIHIGKNKTSCIFIQDNQIVKTFSYKIGSIKLTDAYLEDKKSKNSNTDILKLNPKSKLKNILTKLKKEIEKAFIYFCKDKEKKYPMIVTGDLNSFSNLSDFFKLDKVSNILQSPSLEKKPELKKFALCIGLSLNLLATDSVSPQFRFGDNTPIKTLESIGKKILLLTAAFYVFLGLISFSSSYFLKTRENFLHKQLISLKNFENNYLSISKKFQHDNFYTDFDEYEKKLQNETKKFPYILSLPNVSETLDWLNNHEYLQDSEITSFNYVLEKYPTVFAKTESYAAKIELEFKTKKSSIAKSFYESLTQGEGLVNPIEKISWQPKKDRYKTIFYLKNMQKL